MTVELNLVRVKFLQDRTIGTLDIGDVWRCWTLEDAYREIVGVPVEQWKIKSETAIPMGRYRVRLTYSNRFDKVLPLLDDVPGFIGVRIHSGNTPHDTEGCILIGNDWDESTGNVLNSRAAMNELMQILTSAAENKDDVWINIK